MPFHSAKNCIINIQSKKVIQIENNPVASPEAIVISGEARFIILTSQLIRMEWDENAQFEDNASFVFINRNLPVPAFKIFQHEGWLIIQTENLTLKYLIDSGVLRKITCK